ncbi:MAG: acyclic terpene utilization AtuA family protein [Rhizobiaceae bacterium]
MASTENIVRIGGASGYWGDTARGPAQLFGGEPLDYVVFDYLAEITMSVLAKAKSRDPEAGYASDFVTIAMKPYLRAIAERRIKVVANAGGLNLVACRRALQKAAEEAGVSLRIGTVEGDDLSGRIETFRDSVSEMDSGAPLPARLLSANAYLGAFPIAAALDAGADIVITGRCVDSALVVGPLIHEFGWGPADLDRLAAASLAGHLLECGAQATGGNFTDWAEMADGWANTGFPIAEVSANGDFVLTKPAGTGGSVTPLTAAEQMLYEIGHPAGYLLPDVTCDFTNVQIRQDSADRVVVTGARGFVPPDRYKVSATYAEGHACIGCFVVAGEHAVEKARRQGEAVLRKAGEMLAALKLPPFDEAQLQIVGSESLFGDHANPALAASREVVLRIAVRHPQREGTELFSREFIGAGLSMAPGLTLLSPGRPKTSPVVRLFSFLVDKGAVDIAVAVDGEDVGYAPTAADARESPPRAAAPAPAAYDAEASSVTVPLRRLAVARSGDKGDKANIGVIARRPEFLPAIRAALTPQTIRERFGDLIQGEVERFDLAGVHALNFLLHRALGGGGAASLSLDTQGKTYAQILLDTPIRIAPADAARWNVAD